MTYRGANSSIESIRLHSRVEPPARVHIAVCAFRILEFFSSDLIVSANYAFMGMWRNSLRRIPPVGISPVEIRGAVPCRGASTGFMVATGGVLSENGHGGPGVRLGDGKTEAEGVPSQGGRGDALLRPDLYTS